MNEPRRDRGVANVGTLAVLPVFFDLNGKRAVVAGGSAAAAWKAELLAAAGAQVEVYAAAIDEEMASLAASGGAVRITARGWGEEDLIGAGVAVGDLPEEEAARFFAAGRSAGAPVNVIDRPQFSDFQFGVVVERSPLVVGISTAGAAPVLAQAARARIEAALPQGLRDWAARAASWRPHIRARRMDANWRRRFWTRFAARAFEGREAAPPHEALETLVRQADRHGEAATGSVALVGAGPGDPELMTLKAVRALQTADVVLYDDLASPEAVAMARREAQKIRVGKRGYKPSCTQEDITGLMIALAREGKRVVRLKGGDPLLFGRANEEMDALAAAGIPIELAPGVTSASAAAASLARSLTERDLARRVQFVTAHAKGGRLPSDLNWAALADPNATTAVYMGLRTLPELVEKLLSEGLDPQTPAALIENISRKNERRLLAPVGELARRAEKLTFTGPSLVLIGRSLAKALGSGED